MYTTTRRRQIARNARRAARADARDYRRTYGRTYPRQVARLSAVVVGGIVAALGMGLVAVWLGGQIGTMPDRLPTGDTYEYHRTTTCPTEDSCDAFGHPVVP